ncbi:long-chain fatty acid--CoA ligase [Sphingopyxis sp. YF1]|uniref:AMP-binding protein n=1 Tax=unclassified Sphingopyxis TaxID=2614943 RepID=UPI001F6211D8|nr:MULTISPECIES: AMP-binding protein [unclassified Sphingopyxis]UNU44616.1 long-chain fatty acid--CoA ligase [Sphingopyxis sp. YF1]USI76646.1 AMP-binding protein [Sphingopyxis sp. USTB-05]
MTATVISGSNLITGSTIDQRAAKVATGLAEMGIGAGDTVAILLRNDPVFFEISFGANLLGANVVPVNWHFRSDEALFVIADSGAKLIVAHEDLLPVLGDHSSLSLPILVCPVPQEVAEAYGSPVSTIDEWASWRDKHAEWRGEPQITRFGMIYTSGTTGKPKGVKREPADAEMAKRMAALMATALGLVPGQTIRTVITGPIYHAAPNTYALVAGRVGELVVMQPRFDAEGLLALIEHHRLTHVHLVPTMFVRLLKLPEQVRSKYDLSSLRFVAHGAAPCPPEIKQAMIAWWGPIIHEYYGGSETGGAVYHNSEEALRKPGTVGRAMDGCAIRILDDEGNEVPAGTPGHVYIRSTSFPDFTYHGRDADRLAIEREGFVTIGDIGFLDEDGYLFLCDRANDMIISGGVNIYPAEIEAVLLSHPGIADAAVFGVPDAEFGEAVCAAIQPADIGGPDASEVRAFVRSKLAAFKAPRHVEFHSTLPREDSGKILRRLLKEPHWAGTGRTI